eukprot:NODE_317_length_11122_cov_0.359521.p5 type:complete len:291 gc:universal NODE_317_length_11122_cov_0.359521:7256-8128(+)
MQQVFLKFLLFLILTLAVVLIIWLFGPSATQSKNRFVRLVGVLYLKLDLLFSKTYKILNKLTPIWFQNWFSFVAFKRHPLMQVLFVALYGTGVLVFLLNGYSRLANNSLSIFHSYFSLFVIYMQCYFFYKACFANPGIINNKNAKVAYQHYPIDNIIFFDQDCKTCKFKKPARSKHCSLCNVCVAKSDHHCPWLNACVGQNNIKFFFGFLLWLVFSCYYCFYLVFYTFMDEMKELGMIDRIYTIADWMMIWRGPIVPFRFVVNGKKGNTFNITVIQTLQVLKIHLDLCTE